MIVKYIFDFLLAFIGIIILLPVLVIFSVIIWLQDFHNPFYIAPRVGKDEKLFKLIKFRSMVVGADKIGVDSTSINDERITKVGQFIRKYKIDEIPSLVNVIKGDVSFVGPRFNVKRETDIYTQEEKKLLSIRPGITDFSSIIFSDEGDILADSKDPDIDYNQLIRPWKSRLGLFYIENHSIIVDLKVIFITAVALISRNWALKLLYSTLDKLNAPEDLLKVSLRQSELIPTPPPGAEDIVYSRT